MNALELLLETTPMRALGWTLVHFVWQGVALFVVHEILQVMLRRRSAAARYGASCVVLVGMMASAGLTMHLEMQRTHVGIGNVLAPMASLDLPVRSTSDDTAREGATPPVVTSKVSDPHISSHPSCLQTEQRLEDSALASVGARLGTLAVQPLDFLHARAPRLSGLLPWLVTLWLAGVFLLTTRLAIGWQEARWLRNRAVRTVEESTAARFHELLQQLRISRPVKVLESALAEVPTVVGWLRPVVLLPTAAITGLSPRHLEALLAHELTHIKRHDYLVNLIQTMVETLLFYHPAVWWVSNRIRDERENCCDDVAVQVCGNAVVYARALTSMEELRSGALRPELAMAADGGSLVQRVRRLVGRGGEPATPGAGVVVGAILVALASLLAVSAGRTIETEPAGHAHGSNDAATLVETANLGGKIAGIREAQPAPQLPRPGAVSVHSEPLKAPRLAAQPQPQPQPVVRPNQKAAFQLDEIVRMKQFGVDVEFYEEMTELFGDLAVDELVALKMYDVNRQYVQEMSELFEEELEFEEVVHLRQQGIEAHEVEELMEQGVEVDVHEAIALHLMGVQAEALQDLQDLQIRGASMDDLVQLAQLGLDADDVAELQDELGILTISQSIALLTNGVDANEIEELRDMGMHHLDAETLVHMYTMGLTADVIDTILDDEMEAVPVDALLLFKELGLEDVFLEEFRRRNP